jgi:phenylpyruvate tautomerase PptA (4-oxalocrotonate tautomerase family)
MKDLYAELIECVAMGLSNEAIANITGLPKEAVAVLAHDIETEQMRNDLYEAYGEYYGA